MLRVFIIVPLHIQSKPMVDLQSERNGSGHVVLTCVLFPQEELDDVRDFAGMGISN